ncbi:MAG: hypothetical protein COB30_012660 [Ectothiorhodospiraceae bacterium]|nr:hypothetical protein [Ectothiorhodospiraceae bacterium]
MDDSSRKNYCRALWVSAFAQRSPKIYLGFAVGFMLLGYAFLLAFPFFIIEGIIEGTAIFTGEVKTVGSFPQWLVASAWGAGIVFCVFMTRQVFQLHFSRISGLSISEEMAPALYALVSKVRNSTAGPDIKQIVITDQYELTIEETPRTGYPMWTSSTLVIGLPMLQTLSEQQFYGELVHRFSQYASGKFHPSHWLYRTQRLWTRYLEVLNKRHRLGDAPLRWFFSFYAPFFETLTLPARRMDELAGDSAALDWMHDREYFESAKSSIVADIFLDAYFWRRIYQSALANPSAKLKPFTELDAMSGHLKSKDFRRKWLQGAFASNQDFSRSVPSLRIRMDNMGQSQLRGVPIVEKTAAEAYLGDVRHKIVSILDALWRSTTLSSWKVNNKHRHADFESVKKLSRKSHQQMLTAEEVWSYARLAKQLRGDSLRKSIVKLIKRNLQNFTIAAVCPSLFHKEGKSAHNDS